MRDLPQDLDRFLQKLNFVQRNLDREDVQEKLEKLKIRASGRTDPWGMDLEMASKIYALFLYLYEDWFRVETYGCEHVDQGACMFVANHGGQLPIDGAMLACSLVHDCNPPRIARGMVERFAMRLPFVNTFMSRTGMVVGDPHNCANLLEHKESIMVFPEGVKGSGKPIQKAYQLQRFGLGFMRLAIRTRTPIVPVSIVGTEEVYPSLFNFKSFAKVFGFPYFPITPFFPWLGPLGAIPIPSKIRIYFDKPICFHGDPDAPDEEIDLKVEWVKKAIRKNIHRGLVKRKSIIHG
jgi:1-acyl-sn-glycerol-3-phosphate acyltransferase